MKLFLSTFCIFLFTTYGFNQTLLVKPYLQDATPTSIYILWETNYGTESKISYNTTPSLQNGALGTSQTGNNSTQIHTVHLTNLQPDTKYFYAAVTDNLQTEQYFFVTPPLPHSEKSFNIVAMSDMQQDVDHPGVFSDIINNNLLPFIEEKYTNDLPTDLAYIFIPGDLVANGTVYDSWASTFFTPAENLFSYVPLYPVLGNHEQNAIAFFKYFQLPDNGTHSADYPEHWWYKDYSNVRLIGLDSNPGYQIQTQLDWLEHILDETCTDDNIDFVFAQLHHPYHSELWIDGNTDFTGRFIELLENFSTSCGKPSAHFFGHTHGYSRGQSKNHNHLMVNVATAGGAIDNWGEFEQHDYPEFVRSDDDFGFVLIEIQAGDDPQFLLSRLSHGSYEDGLVTNVLKDSIRIRLHNHAPETPLGLFPTNDMTVRPDCVLFKGSPYIEEEGDRQGAAQWQIATDSEFENIIYDKWRNRENWYYDVNIQALDNLEDEKVITLAENTTYYWRVRYRDIGLAWSDWSSPILFHTSDSESTSNLLLNPGAEAETSSWVEDFGSFESILSGDCDGNTAHSGDRLFAVGGVCQEFLNAKGHQDIDVSEYSSEIANGTTIIRFGGYLSDYDGHDRPEFSLELFDASGNKIDSTERFGAQTAEWTYFLKTIPAPSDLATIRMILTGELNAGQDNDSYFDDMFVQLNFTATNCEELVEIPINKPPRIKTKLTLFPNPAHHTVTIHSTQWDSKKYSLIVYDQLGRTVWSKHNLMTKNFKLNVSGFPAGIYQLRAFGATADYGWGRLVIEH